MTDNLAFYGGVPSSNDLIGYGRQSISEDDVAAVVDCLKGDFLTCGPATVQFEDALRNVTQAKHVTAVANGTAALHVACMAAGIGPGDEVIVSAITFAASANCALYCGATPVFADIKPDTWNIDPASVRSKITDRTKAVVAVDFGGCPVDADEIRAICNEHGLVFIEDAAHSLGTKYKGVPVGSVADITTLSFHPVKTITTGEGGAVVSNSDEYGRLIELYAKHGITRDEALLKHKDEGGWYYEQQVLGYNYRISDIEAALGVSQIARLEEVATRRREIVEFYNQAFEGIPEVSFQIDATPEQTVRHLYCLRFDVDTLGTTRRFIFDALRAENIGVNVHYLPVYWLPYYQQLGYEKGLCPEAESYYNQAVTLPLHCCMTNEDAQHVVDAVKKVIGYCRDSKE